MFNSVVVFFFLLPKLVLERHTAIRWWASMIISDEIELATNVNQWWNENLRNYSDYRIAIPIKFGNREWCDDDKGICHKVWNVQNFCSVCFLKLFPFYFLVSFVVVVVVRANPNPKIDDLMENARGQKRREHVPIVRLDEEIIMNTSEAELKWRASSKLQQPVSFSFCQLSTSFGSKEIHLVFSFLQCSFFRISFILTTISSNEKNYLQQVKFEWTIRWWDREILGRIKAKTDLE